MKNKTAPPSVSASTPFYFADHFPFHKGDYDSVTQLFNIALTYDIFNRKGAQYHCDGERGPARRRCPGPGRISTCEAVDTEVRRLLLGGRSARTSTATHAKKRRIDEARSA